jgi:hypothetical protein
VTEKNRELERIIDLLGTHRQRATYGAVAAIVKVVSQILRRLESQGPQLLRKCIDLFDISLHTRVT